MYDYLVVGSGLFGAVFARQATDARKKVLVIDNPSFIIKRLPVRLTFDNNYFNALYQ